MQPVTAQSPAAKLIIFFDIIDDSEREREREALVLRM
jgi:hypothetical protein